MMYRTITFTFASALLACLPLAAGAASYPITVPADSFINRHVDSLAQMSNQVTLDPVVRRRLARHFHTSGPAIARYIQDNLVLKTTIATQRYQVACVSRTGREYTINALVPKGTPVFVLRTTRQPILKLACGNPMVSALPVVRKAGSEEELPGMADVAKPKVVAPAKIIPKLAPQMASKIPVVVNIGGKPSIYLMPGAVTKVAGGLYELSAPSSHFPLGFLAGIPLAAGLLTHHGSGNGTVGVGIGTGSGTGTGLGIGTGTNSGSNSGGGTGTVTGTSTGGNTGVSPVPEPSASVAFAVGGVGLVILLAGAGRRRKPTS